MTIRLVPGVPKYLLAVSGGGECIEEYVPETPEHTAASWSSHLVGDSDDNIMWFIRAAAL